MQTAIVLTRLERFLTDLDVKFQAEGLFPEEEEARNEARLFRAFLKHYYEQYGEGLFDSTLSNDDVVIKTLRDRVHLLEGDEAAIMMILGYCGHLKDTVLPTMQKAIDALELAANKVVEEKLAAEGEQPK